MASQGRNRRALLKGLALLGLAAAFLFVSAGREARAGVDTVIVPSEQPIQIAVVVALSGDLAVLGEFAVKAVEMAIEDHGSIQGFSVQQNNFDGQCAPAVGEAAAAAVVSNPQNVGVVGHLCSGSYASGLPIYEGAGVVTISGSTTGSLSLLWPSGPTVFNRTVISDPDFLGWVAIVQALPTVLAWQDDFQDRFGGPPEQWAELLPFYYDATRLLLTRIGDVAEVNDDDLVINRADLAEAVRDTEDFPGVTCFVTLDEFGSRVSEIDQLLPCLDIEPIDSTMPNSLYAMIDAAVASATRGNICAAVHQLDALRNQIEAQTGNKISEDAATVLLEFITNVQNYLLIVTGEGSC